MTWLAILIAISAIVSGSPAFADPQTKESSVGQQSAKSNPSIERYQKALKERAYDAEVFFNLGICFENDGQLIQAQNCYERAAELRPTDGYALKALKDVKRRISYQLLDEVAENLKCRLLFSDADTETQIGICKRALSLSETGRAWQMLSELYSMKGDQENSLKAIQRSFEIDPPEPSGILIGPPDHVESQKNVT